MESFQGTESGETDGQVEEMRSPDEADARWDCLTWMTFFQPRGSLQRESPHLQPTHPSALSGPELLGPEI